MCLRLHKNKRDATFYSRTCETGFTVSESFPFLEDYFARFLEIWKRKERTFAFRSPDLLSSREHLLPLSKLFSREKVCWINTSRQETRKNLSNEATHVALRWYRLAGLLDFETYLRVWIRKIFGEISDSNAKMCNNNLIALQPCKRKEQYWQSFISYRFLDMNDLTNHSTNNYSPLFSWRQIDRVNNAN